MNSEIFFLMSKRGSPVIQAEVYSFLKAPWKSFATGNSVGGLFLCKSTVKEFQKLKPNLTFAAAILAARCTRQAWKNLGILPFFHA